MHHTTHLKMSVEWILGSVSSLSMRVYVRILLKCRTKIPGHLWFICRVIVCQFRNILLMTVDIGCISIISN